MKKTLLAFLLLVVLPGAFAQGEQTEQVVTFRFIPGDDMFRIPWRGNDAELTRLYNIIDNYLPAIESGKMPVYVDAYSSSMRETKKNLNLAFVRANRVKSELILKKGLKEKHFITKNYVGTYQGHKNIVVVTIHLPEKIKPESHLPQPDPVADPDLVTEPDSIPIAEPQPELTVPVEPTAIQANKYSFDIRTNLLYDAFLTPTLGLEWRINHQVGIKLDGSYAHWGNNHGKVQKLWLINPEVRWYMGNTNRFYVGAGATIGEYNLYKYMLGSLFSGNTGYQGNIYGGGVTVGYQLPLCNRFSIDFNLGLGYTRFKYDSFTISNDVRVYKELDKSKNFWGPTQVGITLVWNVGQNK